MDYTQSHRIMAVMLEHNRAVCWLDTTGRIAYIYVRAMSCQLTQNHRYDEQIPAN